MKKSYRILLSLAVAATAATALFAVRNDAGLGRNMEMMVNLMRELSLGYVDPTDADKMMADGAAGICSQLDPYTEFIPEKEMADFETFTTGRYGGIGSLIRQDGDWVVFAEPYRNSPADRAGIQIGDRILAIDGTSARGFSTADVSSRLRGEAGSSVRVKIQKLVGGDSVELRIRRERIAIPSISYAGYVADGVGYIRHDDFTDGCYDQMRAAIARLQSDGELQSLILDYRGNGGGVLQSAVKVLSLFLPKGTAVVETKGRTAESAETFSTEYEPMLPDTPLAVLISGGSASAAEIVAGAIQDMDRGVLVGQRSFGKGLVQSTRPVGYNSYVKMTTAKYYIPSGRCIQAVRYSADGKAVQMPDSLVGEFSTRGGRKVYDGGGIMPDIAVEPEYVSNFAMTLYLLGIIDDFGDDYFIRHSSESIDPRTFSITDGDYADFVRLVESRDVPYKSDSRRALETLRTTLERERYHNGKRNENLENALAEIDKNLRDDCLSNLEVYRQEITDAINSNIVLRYAYADGVTANSLDGDREIAEAVMILENTSEYNRILREQDTPRK